jgi:hypothetical protein
MAIRQQESKTGAYVSIDSVSDEEIEIIGNPAGLRLLAASLIEKSLEIENRYFHAETNYITDPIVNIPVSVQCVDSPQNILAQQINTDAHGLDQKGNSFGCIFILLAIVALIIMGIIFLIRLF